MIYLNIWTTQLFAIHSVLWIIVAAGHSLNNVATIDELNKLRDKTNVLVLGLFKDLSVEKSLLFKKIAEDMTNKNPAITFAITSSETLLDRYYVANSNEAVIVFNKAEKGKKAIFTGKYSESELLSFIQGSSEPLVYELNEQTAAELVRNGVKRTILLLMNKKDKSFAKEFADMRSLAKEKRGKMRYVFADANVPASRIVMQMFNVPTDQSGTHLRITLQDEDARDFYDYLAWYDRFTTISFKELQRELCAIRKKQKSESEKKESKKSEL